MQVKNITLIFVSSNQNNMKEIKIIPLVLAIAGLISCGIAVGSATNDLTKAFSVEAFIMLSFAVLLFIVILLLSVGVIGEKNKFVW